MDYATTLINHSKASYYAQNKVYITNPRQVQHDLVPQSVSIVSILSRAICPLLTV